MYCLPPIIKHNDNMTILKYYTLLDIDKTDALTKALADYIYECMLKLSTRRISMTTLSALGDALNK